MDCPQSVGWWFAMAGCVVRCQQAGLHLRIAAISMRVSLLPACEIMPQGKLQGQSTFAPDSQLSHSECSCPQAPSATVFAAQEHPVSPGCP